MNLRLQCFNTFKIYAYKRKVLLSDIDTLELKKILDSIISHDLFY